METLYRRPLPAEAIAFSSPEGRQLFAEALTAGGLEGYFPLAEQFHTQSDPAFCGLGSLVVALNALAIDPGRLWKGPWRWFAEDLLDCCVPLVEVKRRGLDLDELACLARCNGAEVQHYHVDTSAPSAWREALDVAARGDAVLVAAYDRSSLDQTGRGHFSPIGGYHAARDLALVLDVARFKYPPHWVPTEKLWQAMQPHDPRTGKTRGWMLLRQRQQGIALGFSVKCDGENWYGFARRLTAVVEALGAAADVAALAQAILPLTAHLELHIPSAEAHRQALDQARFALRSVMGYPNVVQAIGEDRAEAVTLLLLAVSDLLSPTQQSMVGSLAADPSADGLAADLATVRYQLTTLWRHASEVSPGLLDDLAS